jgi:hypothetical protein
VPIQWTRLIKPVTRGWLYPCRLKMKDILTAIVNEPKSVSMPWQDIETLLLALGAKRVEGRKGRVAFLLNNKRADFKRPPANRDTPHHHVRYVREFLLAAGVKS